jgi:transposase InsO family protein
MDAKKVKRFAKQIFPRKGRSIDNIVMERFSHRECKAQERSIKYEDIYPSSYTTIKEVKVYWGHYKNQTKHKKFCLVVR